MNEDREFVDEIINNLSNEVYVLLHQKHTHIAPLVETIYAKVKERFKQHFYHFITPHQDSDKQGYYTKLGEVFGASIVDATQFQEALGKIAHEHQILLYINNFENNSHERASELSTAIRNLKDAYPNFHAILIGKEQLANMCYRGNATLSPLNNSIKKVFPNNATLEPTNIISLIKTLSHYDKKFLAEYLDSVHLGYFDIADSLKMRLFWCNILNKNADDKLYWKDTKALEVIRELIAPPKATQNHAGEPCNSNQKMGVGGDNSGIANQGNGNTFNATHHHYYNHEKS